MSDNPQMSLKDKFLNYHERLDWGKPETWPNYVQHLELTEDDIPELIALATIDDDEVEYEQMFACRALGQLKALSAVSPLISFLETVSLYDDWAYEEIPMVLSLMLKTGGLAPIVQLGLTRGAWPHCRHCKITDQSITSTLGRLTPSGFPPPPASDRNRDYKTDRDSPPGLALRGGGVPVE
jgi:hypothetical protein